MAAPPRIVVGVDGSEGGQQALRWALDQAAAHEGTVRVVTAYRWDDFITGPMDFRRSPRQCRDDAENLLLREISALPSHRGVRIASQAVEGLAPDVLTRLARTADLLVLGSHGHSAVRHIALGSVSEECVRLATCPVVIVPAITKLERQLDLTERQATIAVGGP
jgi:nucleotide-binding universal stress UspA family protein